MDHARKLKFSSYVHLPFRPINKMYQYRYSGVIQCNLVDVIIFEHGCYIKTLGHIRISILSRYILLACIDTIYEYCHAL